jgi:type I restriction-modification system DNA methylase subunit
VPITYEGRPINWIPNEADLKRVGNPTGPVEIRPTIPPAEVLASKADEINRLLRESDIKDEFRPIHVAAVMLALWFEKGNIRRSPENILKDINQACREAFLRAGKPQLAKSIAVNEANKKLQERAPRITSILERLNVAVLTAEHDYLGQLYETFFRYTGGNTIGQYFTPRHIARFLADVCLTTPDDIVLDIACGTGGFFVAHMDRLVHEHGLTRDEMVKIVKEHVIGFESEPTTAALCAVNMILRGDGSTKIEAEDSLRARSFPIGKANVSLKNPPFPHKQTDTPVEKFIERGLEGLVKDGKLAVIVPQSLLSKSSKGLWRERLLKKNSLVAVFQLPDELFQPYAAATTSALVFEKGTPQAKTMETVFVRLNHDGLALKKGVRIARPDELNSIPEAIQAVHGKKSRAGFSGTASLTGSMEWSAGAYIPSSVPDDTELKDTIDVQLRRLASFYARYAREVIQQREAIKAGEIASSHYRSMISSSRLKNTGKVIGNKGTIGGSFDVYYGMKELHSREGYSNGQTLIISPTESYNGTYGWLDFPRTIDAPFVTVAQTGSIGEAFVQLEPCAVNDDCLIILPKAGHTADICELIIVAATLQIEKWRFNYGRKLTPDRISGFVLPDFVQWKPWVDAKYADTRKVIDTCLSAYNAR